jgi:heme o synthase
MRVHLTDTQATIQPTWRDYVELTRPGMAALLVLPALTAMFIATGGAPGLQITLFATLAGFLATAGSFVLNSYLDKDLDAVMTRTRNRPLSAGRLPLYQAKWIGLSLIASAVLIMVIGVNLLAAALTLAGAFIYIVVYTLWLKRRSVYSTLVGGVAGAFPVLVGWAAATGSLSFEVLLFFGILFYWTPVHYWSLALVRRDEYIKVGLPILPVLNGPNATRLQIGRYTVLMSVLTLIPVGLGLLNSYYAVAALLLGGFMVFSAGQLYINPTPQIAGRYYKHSILYIALLFFAMLADRALF